jgi:16S rRNA U516 pseudouridylate synthase RsuA-like enzyme
MVVAMHNEVKDLKRTKVMNITLGKLAPGAYRRLDDKELGIFLTSLGL